MPDECLSGLLVSSLRAHGLRTKVHYRPRLGLRHGKPMVNLTRRRRHRSLRPPTSDPLAEGSVVRAEPEDRVTVEIAGGPPGVMATIQVDDTILRRVRLDACGAGRADIPDSEMDGRLEVRVDNRVLLAGQVPARSDA